MLFSSVAIQQTTSVLLFFCVLPFLSIPFSQIETFFPSFVPQILYEAKIILRIVCSFPNILLSLYDSFHFIENILMIFFSGLFAFRGHTSDNIFTVVYVNVNNGTLWKEFRVLFFMWNEQIDEKSGDLTMLNEEKRFHAARKCLAHLSEQKLLDNDW